MRRWLSISLALGTLLGVVLVGVYSISMLHAAAFSAPSSPAVTSQPVDQSAAVNASGFTNAQSFFKSRGILLSVTPTAKVPGASWNEYHTTDQNVLLAASELQGEFSKYSAHALKSSGIKSIYLVANLYVDGQYRSGMPEPRLEHALYFDVSEANLQSEDGAYMKRTFNHEFSHLIEYDLFGSFTPKDKSWTDCNLSNFAYGKGGPAMYSNPDYAHKSHPAYGFVDGYATSAIEEDKAEMFAYFMTDPILVRSLANKDAGVACKLNQTEILLQKL